MQMVYSIFAFCNRTSSTIHPNDRLSWACLGGDISAANSKFVGDIKCQQHGLVKLDLYDDTHSPLTPRCCLFQDGCLAGVRLTGPDKLDILFAWTSNATCFSDDKLLGGPRACVRAVKRWLDEPRNNQWLIIYDNFDNPVLKAQPATQPAVIEVDGDTSGVSKSYDIRPFLQGTHHGAVLITTRSAKVEIGYQIPLGKLKILEDGLKILANTSNHQDLENDDDAIALAKELDGLPLGLSTAAAYLNNVSTTFSQYLAMYRDSWLRLQQTTPDLLSYENRSLYSTWDISYRQVMRQNANSAILGY